MRHTTRVGHIGDDESGHVGQCGDRPRQVLAGGLVEIKQDRRVIALAKLVSNRVENNFSLRRETAQNQNYFGSDRVDDAADFFVIQKQVKPREPQRRSVFVRRLAIDLSAAVDLYKKESRSLRIETDICNLNDRLN